MKRKVFTGFEAAIFLEQLQSLEVYSQCLKTQQRQVQLICQQSNGQVVVHDLVMLWGMSAAFDQRERRRLASVNITIETAANPGVEFDVIVHTSCFTSTDGTYVTRVEIPKASVRLLPNWQWCPTRVGEANEQYPDDSRFNVGC